MQARMKLQNEIVIVSLKGRVDVETAEPFRAALLRELKGKRVVFDFSDLNFVGSQGILPFLETLQAFYELSPGSFKFSGVGVEFRKLFAATPLNIIEIHERIEQAIMAFYVPAAVASAPSVIEAAPLAASEYIAYRSEPTETKSPAPSADSNAQSDDELDA